MTTNALIYESYGKPLDVLRMEERPLADLHEDEVKLRILAAPINPADLGRLNGSYGSLADLPAIAGLEGIAEIAESGSAVTQLKVGQRVFVPSEIGSWQTMAITKEDALSPAPDNLSLELAAMGWVNPPTAWLMLHRFAKIEEGDWIVQNAGTSAVAKLVSQFAKALGVKTISLVRNEQDKQRLLQLGAEAVFLDNEDAADNALSIMDGAKAKLCLNAIGGPSAYQLVKCMQDGGSLVTYGGAVKDAAPFPTRYLIFNDIQLRGFWLTRYYKDTARQEAESLHRQIFSFMETNSIGIDVAKSYPLEEYEEALEHAFSPGKSGKVLFRMNS